MNLKFELSEIDKIKDDAQFIEAENDFIRQYCLERNFELSEDDLKEISNRGMDDALEFWKEEYLKDK